MNKFLKITLALFFISTFILIIFDLTSSHKETPPKKEHKAEVKAEDVEIIDHIKLQQINFTVYPEKRQPHTLNWSTIAHFQVIDPITETLYFETTPTTNDQGRATISLGGSENVPHGNQTVLIKGASHLTKRYENLPFLYQFETFDFTPYGDLIAGDTNASSDDTLNSLDVVTLTSHLNTNDYRNDLNYDGIVNSLDLSMQIYNFGLSGES